MCLALSDKLYDVVKSSWTERGKFYQIQSTKTKFGNKKSHKCWLENVLMLNNIGGRNKSVITFSKTKTLHLVHISATAFYLKTSDSQTDPTCWGRPSQWGCWRGWEGARSRRRPRRCWWGGRESSDSSSPPRPLFSSREAAGTTPGISWRRRDQERSEEIRRDSTRSTPTYLMCMRRSTPTGSTSWTQQKKML